MTRLFNLESYCDLCTYANLYASSSEIKTPAAYKSFLDRYGELGYRRDSLHPPELTVLDELMPLKHLGVNLSSDGDRLYVVGDRLNSLSLRNFLRSGEQYIYQSVYHYWNYRQQIANNLDLSKPVIFIDLCSVTSEPYCSLRFEQYPNTDYLIPIIDNRGKVSNDFQLPGDFKAIYNSIYRDLALEILSRNFPQLASDRHTIEHLESYLQKINLFKLANSGDNSLPVEILKGEQKYYKAISLDLEFLEQTVVNHIDFIEIDRFTQQYPQYSFVLISEYNFLERFRTALNNSNIFIPENQLAEFPEIWQEKQQQNFPLFGQYLDKIKFQIKRGGEIQWIEVLSTAEQEHIYYEGEVESKHFVARIQDTGQEYFKLKNLYTILPIKINESDYCSNGIPQEYAILHPLAESKIERDLDVKIEFIIKLGSAPDLKVTDRENKYKIEAQLRDRQEIETSLSCIPLQTIREYREQQFKTKVPDLQLCTKLNLAFSSITKINSFEQLPLISNSIRSANEIIKLSRRKQRSEPFLFINPKLESLQPLNSSIQIFFNSGVVEALIKYFEHSGNISSSLIQTINSVAMNILNLIGRTHKLSEPYISYLFFNWQFIKKITYKIGVSYFVFLAKVAFKKEFQLAYFSFFYLISKNKPCYQIKDYLWGYSRILLWYSEFYRQYKDSELDYSKHFKSICSYLLDNKLVAGSKSSQPYQQDAFLALIYLLTFREADSKFCTKNSEEYQLAEKVIKKYQQSLVYLKAVPDRSLNLYFEELLNGNSSQEQITGLFEL